ATQLVRRGGATRVFRCLALFGQFALQRQFALGVLLAAGAGVSNRQLIMPSRVIWHYLDIPTELWNRFLKLARRIHRRPKRENRVAKGRIYFRGRTEVKDRIVPLPFPSRQLAEPKLRGGVVWVNLQFLRKFVLGVLNAI